MVAVHIKAGAEFNVASPKEVEDILRKHLSAAALEYGRGKTFRNFSSFATVANNAIVFGSADAAGSPRMSPDDGFTWSVKRLTVVGLAVNDVIGVYRNNTGSLDAIEAVQATAASPWPYFGFGSRQFVLHADERLIVANVGNLTATGKVYVNGLAEEVPSNMEWTL